MNEPIINKVSDSALVTLNLEEYFPAEEIALFDLKDHLFMGLILKEKDFRETLKSFNWDTYRDKYVAINCTVDAIIPVWAYMLVASYLALVAKEVVVGDEKELHRTLFLKNLAAISRAIRSSSATCCSAANFSHAATTSCVCWSV